MPTPVLARTVSEVRAWVRGERAACRRVGLVPTMGALHAGHLSLVATAKQRATSVVVSIFVNPTQFGPGEDLDAYPRTFDADVRACAEAGVGLVFAPTTTEMYPRGYQTEVTLRELPRRWCGASRAHHFGGVATVVLKLLNIVVADVAVFGEKDFQQLRVLQQLADDLHHPTVVVGSPLVRDTDGLALSSRNAYLSADERARALAIPEALQAAAVSAAEGERSTQVLIGAVRDTLQSAGLRAEYVAIVDEADLEPLATLPAGHASAGGRARLLVAAHVGSTRLIDNVQLTAG